MARPFRRTPGGYTASFEPAERDLIRELAEDVRALLRPADTTADGGTVDPLEALVGITENPTIPADSAVARLLPAASSDDEAATEYRRYTERDLRETKRANLAMLAFDIESSDLRLNEEHARAWAAALGDIRLVLADRLYIVDEDTAEVCRRQDADADAEGYRACSVQLVHDLDHVLYKGVQWNGKD
ncbi:MAG: DUF2017 domain-containing protein, partial [Rothia mucilaginosa]